MKKSIQYLSALIALALLSSCEKEPSSSVDQNKIYTEYELAYDKNTNATTVSAVFKFSNDLGTNLELSGSSNVKFNNDVLSFDPVFSYYKKEYNGKIDNGNFVFTDLNGRTYNNSITLANPINNMVVDTIKRSMGAFTYTWTGNPVSNNELINLTLINNADPTKFENFIQNNVGSSSLVLGLNKLNQMPIGLARVNLIRIRETNATDVTSAGGEIRSKYTAQNNFVYIK